MEMNSSLLKSKYDALFLESPDVLSCMFALGYVLERRDHQGNRFVNNWYNPLHDKFKQEWDEEIWLKARRASASASPTEEEFENEEPLTGFVFVRKQINKAIELGHPAWATFYILGEAYGRYNSSEISGQEFQDALKLLPISFVDTYGAKISSLCGHFDEQNRRVLLGVSNLEVVADIQ